MSFKLSKRQDKQWERDLLKKGTAVGPVTQEMIDWCKQTRGGPESEGYEYWTDLLPLAREHFSIGKYK